MEATKSNPTAEQVEKNTDFEVWSLDTAYVNEKDYQQPWWHELKYILAGIFFGIVLVKSEVISWYRIQEMFRLQSFHMYGVIGSAVAVGALSVFLIKKFRIKTVYNQEIEFHKRPFTKGTIFGGLIFGLGWALTGACPGPLYAQLGSVGTVGIVTLLSAIAGTWFYGKIQEKLPH